MSLHSYGRREMEKSRLYSGGLEDNAECWNAWPGGLAEESPTLEEARKCQETCRTQVDGQENSVYTALF